MIWLKTDRVRKSVLEIQEKGVLFQAKLYPFLCKIRVKISESVLKIVQKRGAIFSCGTIMRYAFKYKVITPGAVWQWYERSLTNYYCFYVADECTIFCDLAADPTLFEGTGDYQFQVYRKMKKENE